MSNIDGLLVRLGLGVSSFPVVQQALTHGSAVQNGGMSYERLEFVGDRVLGLGVALLLQDMFPGENEGALARRHALLVKESTLACVARSWELGPLMVLGSSERGNGGFDKDSILADVVEALLAVVWNERGPEAALELVKAVWVEYVLPATSDRDAKTALQELVQGKKSGLPLYTVVSAEGPDHIKVYTVEVACELGKARGTGRNKKEAETAAAQALLMEKGLNA